MRHEGAIVWLTGLSGAGKSTLATELHRAMQALGYGCYTIDGDVVRSRLNSDLGFAPADRKENIRRIGEVAAMFADAGLVCIVASISPYRIDRDNARQAAVPYRFLEVHVEADLATCERRDTKGLYKKARAGEIRDFTGIGAPYESPEMPEYVVKTGTQAMEDSLAGLLAFVLSSVPKPSPRP